MSRVALERITKTFDGKIVAVADFSLEVRDGEFVVVVGPSGCGKTTTLRIIAGLETPDSGDVYIGDTPVNNLAPRHRNVAMVFQSDALYPHMTAYKNMAFALKMRKVGTAEIDMRIRRAAALLGIDGILKRKPASLSGGQRQRVALGRAIVREPKVFLFDEPLSNVDPTMRLAMRAELKTLRTRLRAASVYVTHDQAEAMTLGDRICVVREGRIRQIGAPMEIYDRPTDRFVAGFFGTPAMNFFPGRVQISGETVFFTSGSDRIALPPRLLAAAANLHQSDIVLGIRPEHISLEPSAGTPGNAISATVTAVEPIGSRTDVHLATRCGCKFTASINPNTNVAPNDALRVHLNTERLHLFEPTPAGRNLSLPADV